MFMSVKGFDLNINQSLSLNIFHRLILTSRKFQTKQEKGHLKIQLALCCINSQTSSFIIHLCLQIQTI